MLPIFFGKFKKKEKKKRKEKGKEIKVKPFSL